MPTNDPDSFRTARRGVLISGLAATVAATSSRPAAAAAAEAGQAPPTAAATEGPFYFDARKFRPDITEGRPGVPLAVRFTVLDLALRPWRGARVDIWHCDAQGLYSGYAGQGEDRRLSTEGQTFLRGSLLTDASGVAAFTTIYPGWYHGRTTHIHFKVFDAARPVLTSQFFLPDALNEYLYTQLPDYRRATLRDTLNSTDGIALEAGPTVHGAVREETESYVASLTLVADPTARPVPERRPMPGRPGPPGRAGGPGRGRPDGPPPQPPVLEGAARVAALMPGKG
ncbi:intradiol ring-cleavage dioxygenase [Variovorax sp. J22P271]|uniref:intradiol ring-cleavage dioxygenase n=1 Tax=Variovorax davisae TaxID=3053515 RepID=UPI0025755A0B|nr:intradiol ring-cleavage dioxygenase [Variovorax sp. J22P271]MDM0030625.1 intradiol ring-cleavage dioxygenase [Variovorax sp. J22P271]